MEKIVLIDGNSLLNRAYYATPPLTTKEGVPTNAVFAFVNMLFKVIADQNPTHMLVAFDRKEPTFRHQMYTEYKAGRKAMPDDLAAQLPIMKETLAAMGIFTYERAGIEADDIIGAAAKKFQIPTLIYTGDKDSFQLVDETTTVCFTKRGVHDVEEYTAQNFTEKTELIPSQIIELKSLMGDSSDNIPGVAGVGEKTAKTLLLTYGTLQGVYDHISEIKGKLQEKLIAAKETAFLSRTLATIDTAINLPFTLSDVAFSLPFSSAAKEVFRKLQFFTFLKKESYFPLETQASSQEQTELSILADVSALTPIELRTPAEIADYLAGKSKLFILPMQNLHLSDGKTEAVIKIRETLLDDGVLEDSAYCALSAFLQEEKNTAYFYDAKAFMHRAATFGVAVNCKLYDFSLVKYLADFSGKAESVEEVLTAYDIKESVAATQLFAAYGRLYQKCEEEGMATLYNEVELPLVRVLFDMECAGVCVNEGELMRLTEKFERETAETQAAIYALTGKFNVNSPKQLGEILFEQLRIGKGKKTKTGYSTSKEVLDELIDAHPVVPLILKYRQKQKLLSTYLVGISALLDGKKRLHTSFNQTLTTTGRLSSKEPNLQNIPVRDEEGKILRKMFVSRFAGGKIISADYSQIELRLLAAFSSCAGLIDAFLGGKDVHASTAARIYRIPLQEVTPAQRYSAKAVNFGVIYGMSEYGLSNNIKTSVKEAREFIESYFATYPEVKTYIESNVEQAKQTGYCTTFLGRRRYLPELKSANHNVRAFGERAAMNMPLQGASADIIKKAMVSVAARLKRENLQSVLILQVHDELIVDTAPGEEDAVSRILVEEMQGAATLSVPLTAEVGIGENWFEAK